MDWSAKMMQVAEAIGPPTWFWNIGSHHEYGFSARVWRKATSAEIAAMPKDNQKLYFCVTGTGRSMSDAVTELCRKIDWPPTAAQAAE